MAVVEGGSKCNLITGYSRDEDSHVTYGKTTWLAQTFTLDHLYIVWRCRFKSWTSTGGKFHEYAIRATDANGRPTGADICTTTLSPSEESFYSPGKWRRFDFDTRNSIPPGVYALITRVPTAVATNRYRLRCDASAPTYTQGKACISNDGGATWSDIADTDFMFEVWGWEPPPEGTHTPYSSTFGEPWGDTLTQYNPWQFTYSPPPVDYDLANSRITLYNPSFDGSGIKVDFTPNQIPLLHPDTYDLFLHAISDAPAPLTHNAYIPCFLYTTDGVNNYLIEIIITRGAWWGPWGTLKWGGGLTGGIDYGLDPGVIDITQLWIWARQTAGLSSDPAGWYITTIALLFEAVEYEPNPYLVNNSLDLFYDAPPIYDPFIGPPSPIAPPPPPVISNWAPLDLGITIAPTGVLLQVTTDIPCHLFMRWTNEPPLFHKVEQYRRGIALITGSRYCFVAFHENEQLEPGDTLIHTFLKPNWQPCETRWFYFIGTKQAEEQPSASPIFTYHNIYSVPIIRIDCQADSGWAARAANWIESYQTFLPPDTFLLTELKVRLGQVTGPPTVTASLHTLSPMGWPVSPPLVSETKNFPTMNVWPALSDCSFYNLSWNLEKNTPYAIGMTVTPVSPTEIRWRGSVFNPCPNGNLKVYRRDQFQWYNYPALDLWHLLYGSQPVC